MFLVQSLIYCQLVASRFPLGHFVTILSQLFCAPVRQQMSLSDHVLSCELLATKQVVRPPTYCLMPNHFTWCYGRSGAYEVSRHTLREAVRHLNKAGVLKRERGRG